MKRGELPKLAYTCFPSIPMILVLFFFFLPYLVSKHHMFLFSAYEFITAAKSSRVAVFLVLNVIVIVIMIFLESSKPEAADFDGLIFLSSPSVYEAYGDKEKECSEDYDGFDDNEIHKPRGYDDHEDDDEDDDDDDEDDDEDGDDESDIELKKRIEEFIANIYKKWREESVAERLLCIEPPSEEVLMVAVGTQMMRMEDCTINVRKV